MISAPIRARAFSERGFMVHLKGFGWLLWYDQFYKKLMKSEGFYTCLIVPVVFSCSGIIGLPCSSKAGVMSKTAKDIAIKIHRDAYTLIIKGIRRISIKNWLLQGASRHIYDGQIRSKHVEGLSVQAFQGERYAAQDRTWTAPDN